MRAVSVVVAKPPPKAPPCTVVVFGARGDLTKRLLIPSIYNLARAGLLDDGFQLLGVDHSDCDDGRFRKDLTTFIEGLARDGSGEFGAAKLDPFIANMHVALWALVVSSVIGAGVSLLRPRHNAG